MSPDRVGSIEAVNTIDLGNGFVLGDGGLHLMGVLNCSPESPNSDVFAATAEEARSVAGRHAAAGCVVIDIGARSTRSEAGLTCEEEVARLLPVVETVLDMGLAVSIDTWSPCVADRAADLGVSIINDTSGTHGMGMTEVLAKRQLPTVVMFSRGADPRSSAKETAPDPEEIALGLEAAASDLRSRGVTDIILDPGIGIAFGDYEVHKEQRQLRIIQSIPALRGLGHPVMIPVPRKERVHLTVALASQAIAAGADLLRVHDSAIARELTEMHGR